jgi:sterol desaturase/sphingolipid hydroxylase (fatty acid hydroxylase superfamily)
MNDEALRALTHAYFVANIGVFAFLVVLEGGRDALVATSTRWRHVLRNLGLFATVLFIADGVVLGWWLGVPSMLTLSDGWLTPLALGPLAQFAFGFLLLDFVDYFFHRLVHRWRPLWLLHVVHHSDPHVDTSTAVRFHPIEVSIEMTLKALLLLALGIPLWVEGARAVILNPWSVFQHANIAYPRRLENAIGWLLVTASMHRVHHSPEPHQTNSNFGVVFSFWDRLFGTYVAPEGPRPQRYGLAHITDEARWQSVAGMLLTPVRARSFATL